MPSPAMARNEPPQSLQARARSDRELAVAGTTAAVRLKISSGGELLKSSGTQWQYEGGETRVCLVPGDVSYFELMHYLIETKGYGDCSIRYEDSLDVGTDPVTISTQEDLECALDGHAASGRPYLRLYLSTVLGSGELFLADEADDQELATAVGESMAGWRGSTPRDFDTSYSSSDGSDHWWLCDSESLPAWSNSVCGDDVEDDEMDEVLQEIDRLSPGGKGHPASSSPFFILGAGGDVQQNYLTSTPMSEEQGRKNVDALVMGTSPTTTAVLAAKRRPSPRVPIFLPPRPQPPQPPVVQPVVDITDAAAKSELGSGDASGVGIEGAVLLRRESSAASHTSTNLRPEEDDDPNDDDDDDDDDDDELQQRRRQRQQLAAMMAAAHMCDIPAREISNLRPLDRGGFGQVYKAVWRETDVAVKALPERLGGVEQHDESLMDFKREIALLAKLRHPNIVLYLGTVRERVVSGERGVDVSSNTDGTDEGGGGGIDSAGSLIHRERWRLVTEFVPRGSLFKVIQKSAPARFDWRRRLQIAIGIATGMAFLHSQTPPIAHLDLKSPNVLISGDYTAKVADFGLCREGGVTTTHGGNVVESHGDGNGEREHKEVGTWEWMAPEIMRCERATRKADVFSFGILMWELLMLDLPYRSVANKQLLVHLIGLEGHRPPLPAASSGQCHEAWRKLMTACWAQQPRERPPFVEVLRLLRPLRGHVAAWPTRVDMATVGAESTAGTDPETEQSSSNDHLVDIAIDVAQTAIATPPQPQMASDGSGAGDGE